MCCSHVLFVVVAHHDIAEPVTIANVLSDLIPGASVEERSHAVHEVAGVDVSYVTHER